MTFSAYLSLIENCADPDSIHIIRFCDCHKYYNGHESHNDNNDGNSHGNIKKLLAIQDFRDWRNCISKYNSQHTYVSKFEDLIG